MKISLLPFAFVFLYILTSCGSDDSPSEVVDTVLPSAPLNLTASNITENSALLSWEASTDNVSVTAYHLYENGVLAETNITSTSFSVSSLIIDTNYNYYVTAIDGAGNESNSSNTVNFSTPPAPLTFATNLSEMGIFSGALSNLTPALGVQIYELNSTLFTDYALKQRLVRLPTGRAMDYDNSDLLPKFPDNSLIAKTFYYNIDDTNPDLGKQIIETRVFIKVGGNWMSGNYIWNQAQTDAVYTEDGSELPISFIDINGATHNINYEIPSKQNCLTCHNNNDVTAPIGMKLRSMNFIPSYTSENQLDYFSSKGILHGVTSSNISVLQDWTDINIDILERGRAYIDINCAHCHQPGGSVPNIPIDFRLETPFENTGIYVNRGEIEVRIQTNLPTYRMPQLGRTVIHVEAVAMLLEYLQVIED